MLEETHPDVPFDWSRMLKEKPPPSPSPAGFDELPRRRRAGKTRPQPSRPAKGTFLSEPPPRGMAEEPEAPFEIEAAEPEVTEPDVADVDVPEADAVEPDDIVRGAREAEEAPPPTPRAEFFDAEVLMRLRARYAELKARIAQRIAEPAQRDVLRAEAERLNPDTWVTEEEARTGLDQFERWFEAIRRQLPAPHRRRRRKKKRGGGQGPAPAAS